MIVDERNEFADATSVVNAAATINVGDHVDTHVGSLNVLANLGESPMYLVISVGTAILAGGVGTITFRLVSDAVSPPDLATATVHWTSSAFATGVAESAPLAAGATVAVIALPRAKTYERYLGVQAVIATQATTQGTINAFLSTDASRWAPYADNAA